MKNYRTCYEALTASSIKKIIQPPPNPQPTPHRIKSYYVFGIKSFLRRYTEMYRHLLSKCFKNAVLGRQEMVQRKCSFLTPNRNMFARKFVKSERLFTVLREHVILSNEFRFVNWVVFWAKMHYRMREYFSLLFVGFETFCLKIWKLNKSSDNVHWNVCMNIKTLYARNNIFKKRIPNMRFWSI